MRKNEVFDNQGNVVSSVEMPYTIDELHAHNEFVREQRIEQGQVTFDGITVKTDSRTIEWFNGLYTDAKLDSDFAFSGFNAVSGTTNLTAAQIIGLRNAGAVLIATQFALYNSVKSGINNGDIEYISQIESAYEWN